LRNAGLNVSDPSYSGGSNQVSGYPNQPNNGGNNQNNAISLDDDDDKKEYPKLLPGEELFINRPINYDWLLDLN